MRMRYRNSRMQKASNLSASLSFQHSEAEAQAKTVIPHTISPQNSIVRPKSKVLLASCFNFNLSL